jgi:hypothetical protein
VGGRVHGSSKGVFEEILSKSTGLRASSLQGQ